ncbi:MAG TPA: GTP cyclohydrolase II [Aliidongia sp.]|nr:GTP cyclohydrolase II [Aliidongia sp.]
MPPHEVNRAVADLRRGDVVLLSNGTEAALIQAAEAIDEEGLARAIMLTRARPVLATTLRRAIALELTPDEESAGHAVELLPPADASAVFLRELADPTVVRQVSAAPIGVTPVGPKGLAAAAIELAKLARLLPAIACFPIAPREGALIARREGIIEVGTDQVFDHRSVLARTLRRVAGASVPLVDAEHTRVIAFRPDDGGTDHLAIMIGEPRGPAPVLARIHSECFTGDLLGSLRCDCGDQLRGAIKAIAEAGGGIVIYLAQEGRGIGLVNKLRAYTLQDSGFDTVDANLQLGFESDERVYQPAAEMLRQLGFDKVRLMTNNPEKVAALAQHDIEIVERVPHVFASNAHNRGYLETKAKRSGHLF